MTRPETLTPLITAAQAFPKMEEVVLDARNEVLASFRIFDARTPLRSDAARDAGLNNWADLLAHKAAQGVRLRLLMADFDPVFAADLHRDAWASARALCDVLRQQENCDAQVLVAWHGQEVGPFWKRVLSGQISARLHDLQRQDAPTDPQQAALGGRWTVRPVSLHQKFLVADGRAAVIGGLDVNPRRWDDPDHRRDPEDTWHDISLHVTGRIAADIRAHFGACWNDALNVPAHSFADTPARMEDTPPQRRSGRPRLLRTRSRPATGALRFGPVPDIREHEQLHLAAFASARDSIYIETQFLRHKPLARALARAAVRQPGLQLILVLPTEPERVIFGGDDGLDARHAQALQIECLSMLRAAFGDRLAVISPVQPRPATPDQNGTPVAGAGIVYLHAKVTLVDDRFGIVGSANLNGRSMLWDTEASVLFTDGDRIDGLRRDLAAKWLRGRLPDGADPRAASLWNAAARDNAARDPADREGFVMPYPEARNRRFSRRLPLLPDALF